MNYLFANLLVALYTERTWKKTKEAGMSVEKNVFICMEGFCECLQQIVYATFEVHLWKESGKK